MSSSAQSLCAKDWLCLEPGLRATSTQASTQGHRNHLLRSRSFAGVLCHVCIKLHDLLTKSPVWKPWRYTQHPLPSPCSHSELGMEHCNIPWPLPASPFKHPKAHKHHQQENSAAGQDESQFCWFVLSVFCLLLCCKRKKKWYLLLNCFNRTLFGVTRSRYYADESCTQFFTFTRTAVEPEGLAQSCETVLNNCNGLQCTGKSEQGPPTSTPTGGWNSRQQQHGWCTGHQNGHEHDPRAGQWSTPDVLVKQQWKYGDSTHMKSHCWLRAASFSEFASTETFQSRR